MSAIIEWLEECKREVAALRKELEPYEAGTIHTAERAYGGQWVDTTQKQIAMLKRAIATIEAVIVRHSS